uniref:Uncharacterized protein n=1 Tax=Hyaloperonospora arabidopsidis (strain Emoy2) TaxID=559515 RepID=M4BZ90_HYAAE
MNLALVDLPFRQTSQSRYALFPSRSGTGMQLVRVLQCLHSVGAGFAIYSFFGATESIWPKRVADIKE